MYSPPILDFDEESSIGTLFDTRDGQSYKVVKIGNQIWLAENFRYLPKENEEFHNYWVPGDNYLEKGYGILYDRDTATSIAPEGWKLPSNEDFIELKDFIIKDNDLDMNTVGTYLKSTSGWAVAKPSYNIVSNNKYGFNAKPAPFYDGESVRIPLADIGITFWCSTKVHTPRIEGYNGCAWTLHCEHNSYTGMDLWRPDQGHSVRLLKKES